MIDRCSKCNDMLRWNMAGKPYHFLTNEDRCPTDEEVARYERYLEFCNRFLSKQDMVDEMVRIGNERDRYISALESILDAETLEDAIGLAGGALDD